MVNFGSTFMFWSFIPTIIYLIVVLFVLNMIYRFVKAHEKMADGVSRIEETLDNFIASKQKN